MGQPEEHELGPPPWCQAQHPAHPPGVLPQGLADHVLVGDAIVGEGLVPGGVQGVVQRFGSQLICLEKQRRQQSVTPSPRQSSGHRWTEERKCCRICCCCPSVPVCKTGGSNPPPATEILRGAETQQLSGSFAKQSNPTCWREPAKREPWQSAARGWGFHLCSRRERGGKMSFQVH